MKRFALAALSIALSGCASTVLHSWNASEQNSRVPAAAPAGSEFETLPRDREFEDLIARFDMNAPDLEWEYKSHGTSVGFKVGRNGKTILKFMPKNAAANPETQVVAYSLGRFLGMSELVAPSAEYELRGRAVEKFNAMLLNAREKNKWRLENRDSVMAEISRHPDNLRGVVVPPLSPDTMEALGVANEASNTINGSHPIAQFIQARGPQPSPSKMMALKGVKAKNGSIPQNTELRLAKEFSQIMVLDLLTGQWDRWSGGNVEATYSPETGLLHFIARDNGGASMAGTNGLKKYLGIVSRFDRRQIERVRRLRELLSGADAPAFARALGLRSDSRSLLARADMLLEHVHGLEQQAGEAQVYFAN